MSVLLIGLALLVVIASGFLCYHLDVNDVADPVDFWAIGALTGMVAAVLAGAGVIRR